jgi:Bacterial HORMA domain family 1
MSETYSESATHTFTASDVGKVLDCFAADFDGMGQSTGLRTRDDTKAVAADVKLMAQSGYLAAVNIYLKNAAGSVIRAAKYQVNTNAGTLAASRPGNYLWPRTPGGQLCVHVTHTYAWWELSDLQRELFKSRLLRPWGTLNLDTSFPTLTRVFDRNYVSNGFGLQKTLFT